MSNACKVCSSVDQDRIEELGLRGLSGELSWRAIAREVGWTNHVSIQNHMQKHYVEAELRQVEDEMEVAIREAVTDLYQSMRVAPPEVKPLYAAAIRNLQGLRDTKPSQQHLIMALKTIQEMTGMKQEQRMMLLFAERMFGEVPAPVEPLALDNVIEAELVPDIDESAYASTGGESHGSQTTAPAADAAGARRLSG